MIRFGLYPASAPPLLSKGIPDISALGVSIQELASNPLFPGVPSGDSGLGGVSADRAGSLNGHQSRFREQKGSRRRPAAYTCRIRALLVVIEKVFTTGPRGIEELLGQDQHGWVRIKARSDEVRMTGLAHVVDELRVEDGFAPRHDNGIKG